MYTKTFIKGVIYMKYSKYGKDLKYITVVIIATEIMLLGMLLYRVIYCHDYFALLNIAPMIICALYYRAIKKICIQAKRIIQS